MIACFSYKYNKTLHNHHSILYVHIHYIPCYVSGMVIVLGYPHPFSNI